MEQRDDFYIPEDVAEWIGLKKSEYLSKLIQLRPPGDIGFEEFTRYERFLAGTIERPDRTYERAEDDQTLRTYVRSYDQDELFHQVVIGVLVQDKELKALVFIPILSFVSRAPELVREFSVGSVIGATTLN
jgi:hypothetical protein